MALQASGEISFSDLLAEFTNSSDGTESVTVAAGAGSGQPTFQCGSTSALCVGMRSSTIGVNGIIASLTSGSVTMSANLSSALLTGNVIAFESNAITDYYVNGNLGITSTGAPNVPTTGEIDFSNFYSASAILDFGDPTLTGREYDGTWNSNSADDGPIVFYFKISTGTVNTLAQMVIRLVRGATSGYVVEYRANSATDLSSTGYYNTSNSFIQRNATTAYQTLASGTETPDSAAWSASLISASITGTGGNTVVSGDTGGQTTYDVINQNTFQTLGASESIGIYIVNTAQATASNSTTESANWDCQFKLRKSGYNDADPIVRFSCRVEASAQSTGSPNPNPNPFPV